MRRPFAALVVSFLAAVVALTTTSASAAPAVGPTVTFSIPGVGSAGHGLTYSYSADRVPAGDKVVLQRAARGSGDWSTIRTLNGAQGIGKTGSQSLGRYSWRVAVLRSRRVVTDRTRNTDVFGPVGLSALCADRGPQTACGRNLVNVTIGSRVFHYALRTPLTKASVTVLSLPSTSCTSYSLIYSVPLAANSMSPENEIAFLTLRQAHGQTALSESAANGFLGFSGKLHGRGAVTLTMVGNYAVGDSMTMGGTLNCSTATGR